MDCSRCFSRTAVTCTRRSSGRVVRYRRCPKCGHRVSTEERPKVAAGRPAVATA